MPNRINTDAIEFRPFQHSVSVIIKMIPNVLKVSLWKRYLMYGGAVAALTARAKSLLSAIPVS